MAVNQDGLVDRRVDHPPEDHGGGSEGDRSLHRALERDRRSGDAWGSDPEARLALESDGGELVDVPGEVRGSRVHLLEERRGREVDDQLPGRLDVVERVLA